MFIVQLYREISRGEGLKSDISVVLCVVFVQCTVQYSVLVEISPAAVHMMLMYRMGLEPK